MKSRRGSQVASTKGQQYIVSARKEMKRATSSGGQEPDAECDWQLQDIEEQFFRVGCLQNDGFPEQRQKLAGLRVEKFG